MVEIRSSRNLGFVVVTAVVEAAKAEVILVEEDRISFASLAVAPP